MELLKLPVRIISGMTYIMADTKFDQDSFRVALVYIGLLFIGDVVSTTEWTIQAIFL